ncbi:MAG: hypothetical protein K5978_00435 [Campylobacter sp.]|nr:hypothetical protein [Campylobacter sp.]
MIPTEYDKLKAEYDKIYFTRYKYYFNEPYALENKSLAPLSSAQGTEMQSYTYYPMPINSSFTSINFKRTFVGGRLNTGGLDYQDFIYYDIDDTLTKNSNNISLNFPLNMLLSYICLEELRSTYTNDQEYFYHMKEKKYELDINVMDLRINNYILSFT